jgi:hypothetical protein
MLPVSDFVTFPFGACVLTAFTWLQGRHLVTNAGYSVMFDNERLFPDYCLAIYFDLLQISTKFNGG